MAYTYQGDAILGVSLSVETPKPLDARTVVDTTKDLYNVPASQAYRGMTISNLEDGNIYMLIDKNKIDKSEGWKSSQSALQIITCTLEEYEEWSANTDNNYNPIDESKNYLLQSAYYYIHESEDQVAYLDSNWGKDIQDQLGKKASTSQVNGLTTELEKLALNLQDNYSTSQTIADTYATKESVDSKLDLENPESFISQLIDDYYTSKEVDDKFVTKESLGGDLGELGGDNYVFVTTNQYEQDQKAIQEELDKTLKLDGEGSLESITVGQLKSPVVEGESQLVVDIKSDGLYIGEDPIATESDIPVIIPISLQDYNALVESGEINSKAYYYIWDEENNKLQYVTLYDLEQSYSTTTQIQTWIGQNFYNTKQLDEIVAGLQSIGDYVTTEQIKNYYTITEIDSKFLTSANAETTYATKTDLTDLETKISKEYVTITMLKGENTEDTDFMFVTQTQYSDDKETQALKFESEEINSNVSTTSELIIQEIEEKEVEQEGDTEGEQNTQTEVNILSSASITVKDGNLMKGDQQIALVNDIPQIEPISQTAYNDLIEAGETDPDVYYFIEESQENQQNGYVTYGYATSTFSTKSELTQSIGTTKSELEQKIATLEAQLEQLRSLFNSNINGSTLELGLMDIINDNVLIADSATIENQTLIFT